MDYSTIIQRIALYVRKPSIVKLLFYIPEYRNLISESDYHYDELVLNYSRKDSNTNDLRKIKSFYRLKIQIHMDMVAFYGHLEVVKWIHYNRKEVLCTTLAMDNAAKKGHIEIVKWLHYNRTEGCTTLAMSYAAIYGHLEIIKWLHENRKEGCTTNTMDLTAYKGHFEIIKWLHENRLEGYITENTIDFAAKNGHIEIVKWLQENRYIKN